jgi:hypothetical protein
MAARGHSDDRAGKQGPPAGRISIFQGSAGIAGLFHKVKKFAK